MRLAPAAVKQNRSRAELVAVLNEDASHSETGSEPFENGSETIN
jgi:hypothetical protein